MNTNVRISDETRALAEKRARELGFKTVDEYVDALIREDQIEPVFEDWMHEKIDEGRKSGPPSELTRTKLHDLVREGVGAKSKE